MKEIKENIFYSILADEAGDCSNQEQLSLVLSFVDKMCEIREEFLGFLHCEGLTGRALADTILMGLANLGLEIKNCRGQGYDGANAMSGLDKGVAGIILRLND